MKKTLAMILALCMIFALCACGSGAQTGTEQPASNDASVSDNTVLLIVAMSSRF